MPARDPIMLLALALASGDRQLADALVRSMRGDRGLRRRAERVLALVPAGQSDPGPLVARAYDAIVAALARDA